MGFFDPPKVTIRKRIPVPSLAAFDAVERYAEERLSYERPQDKPYQLGIVLSLWAKTHAQFGKLYVTEKDVRKFQSIYESCVNVARGQAFTAFMILSELYEEGEIPSPAGNIFPQLAMNVAGNS